MRIAILLLLPLLLAMASIGVAATYNLSPSNDAYVKSVTPNANFGSATNMWIGGDGTPLQYYRSYTKFDLTGYAASNIQSAVIKIYISSTQGADTFNLYPITAGWNWTEGTITWNNQPALSGSSYNSYGWSSGMLTGTEVTLNITSFVTSEITAGRASQVSVVFVRDVDNKWFVFYSKENGNPNYVPKLQIVYNGTVSFVPEVQDVAIPSYPNPSTDMKCYATISGTGASVNVSGAIQRFQAGNWVNVSTFTNLNVPTGIETNVGNMSATYVLSGYDYRCMIVPYDSYGYGSAGFSNIGYSVHIGDIIFQTPPSATSLNDVATTDVTTENSWTSNVYGYVECNYESPSTIEYFPNESSDQCHLITTTSEEVFYPNMQVNETGTWSLKSCALYVSNYSDCRFSDLSQHDLHLLSDTFEVADAPRVESVYITPSSPMGSDDLKCYANLTGNASTIEVDYIWLLGNAGWQYGSINVTNNTISLISTLPNTETETGDVFKCSVRGHIGSTYGSYRDSASVTIGRYAVTNITTTPEPSIFGDFKTISWQSGRQTIMARMEYTYPSGATGVKYFPHSLGTNIGFTFGSGTGTAFNESGTYTYTILDCNCVQADFDTLNCPDTQCAFPSDYPAKSKTMRYYIPDTLYFQNVSVIPNPVTFGTTANIAMGFSKSVNNIKLVLTYPDSSTQVVNYYLTTPVTEYTIFLTSGNGKNLSQIGSYSASLYAGYGTSGCIDVSECSYTNSSLSNAFSVAYSADGFIANITTNPPNVYYGQTFNLTYDTSNITDVSCINFYLYNSLTESRNAGKYKTVTNSTGTYNWNVPTTSGDTNFLNTQGDDVIKWKYTITSCKANGTQTCMDSACIQQSGACDYCLASQDNDFEFEATGVSNVNYTNPVERNCGDMLINFTSSPINKTAIRFATLFIDNPEVIFNSSSLTDSRTSWSINVPASTINSVNCHNNGTTTVCDYGNGAFWVLLYDNSGNIIFQSSPYYYTISDTGICAFGTTTNGQSGTPFGQIVGQGLGLNGFVGDMLISIGISIVLTVIVGIFAGSSLGANSATLLTIVFLSSISIFAVAGMLPIWIPIVMIIFAGFLIVRVISGGITGS